MVTVGKAVGFRRGLKVSGLQRLGQQSLDGLVANVTAPRVQGLYDRLIGIETHDPVAPFCTQRRERQADIAESDHGDISCTGIHRRVALMT